MPWWRHPGYTPRRAAGLTGYERVLDRAGLSPVAGIDDAGHGACAGPPAGPAGVPEPRTLSGIRGARDSTTVMVAAPDQGSLEGTWSAARWLRMGPARSIGRRSLTSMDWSGTWRWWTRSQWARSRWWTGRPWWTRRATSRR